MPPYDLHIGYEAYKAVCQDRDRWFKMATEQQQYIQQLEQERQFLQRQIQDLSEADEERSNMPPENDYMTLVRWLEAEKTLGNDYYAEAGYNRSKMCRELRKILGWEPDQNSLRKAQNK